MLKQMISSLFGRSKSVSQPQKGKPGVPNPGIHIVDGKIVPLYGFEVNVVDHCNLTCVDCNHASPFTPKWFADPDQVFRDLSMLAKVTRPKNIKLLGGEPLLHRDFLGVLEAVRKSGICERILLVTNGILLPRQPEAFWEAISELEISVYPGSNINEELLDYCRQKASEHAVNLQIYHFDEFRRTFSIPGCQDQALVERIYRSCKITKVWGCNVIQAGYLFKCPQGLYIPRMLGWQAQDLTRDGIRIEESPGFISDLYDYLLSPTPLESCRHCLDSVGKRRPHTMVGRKEWLAYQQEPYENLVDYEELQRSEREIGIQAPDDIKNLID